MTLMDYSLPQDASGLQEVPDSDLPVIVIGMHRSGTSLVARLLSELGVHIGAKLDNHYESEFFKRINQTLLRDHGACWSDPMSFVSQLDRKGFVEASARKASELLDEWKKEYGRVEAGQLWGWKDPRNTLTLPVWRQIFPKAKVIHVVRNGIDVAVSLRKRDLTSWLLSLLRTRDGDYRRVVSPTIVPAYRLWEEYVRIGLSLETLCPNWLSLHYEAVISQPQSQIRTLCKFLGIDTADEFIASLDGEIIKQPRGRSLLNRIEARLWFKMGVICPDLLVALGYESGDGL